MPKDEILGGGRGELLEFEFDEPAQSEAGPQSKAGKEDSIIDLINPVKRGEIPADILEIEDLGSPKPARPALEASPRGQDPADIARDLEAIFSERPGSKPFPAVDEIAFEPERPALGKDDREEIVPAPDKAPFDQQRLEAALVRAVTETVERVTRQAVESAAERAIREAIDALRETLKGM